MISRFSRMYLKSAAKVATKATVRAVTIHSQAAAERERMPRQVDASCEESFQVTPVELAVRKQ